MDSSSSSSSSYSDKYRSFIHGESEKDTVWRTGAPPNYDVVNKLFEEGKTKEWPVGSLEERVQRLVKSWEMELFHKARLEDCKTLNPHKFTLCVNGRPGFNLGDLKQMGGGYNALLQTSLPKELRCYDPTEETMETSHDAFTTTFPRGFALEVLQVYAGPPEIIYKFRHWGYMEGPFKGRPPSGGLVEVFGLAIFTVDEVMRSEKVEFFYDRGELLGGLLRESPSDDGLNEGSAPSRCPFMNNM
ncbi:hypothetical protein QJS04_geneDACA010030 [Acorus gramineus]|uniref:Pathogen-related protein n=1 Tax=Acorus gramineus TaxID=55184 RepID=A0AAV9BHT5_ACOGR|nr:hypothetical protein QJS04_geneDACA010030 [Acorus gramineus]